MFLVTLEKRIRILYYNKVNNKIKKISFYGDVIMTKYTITALKDMLEKKLSHNFGVTPDQASDDIFYKATVLVLLDIMSERKAEFKKAVDEQESKTIYYLSMEFLMGRSLKNNLYNLDLTETMRKVLDAFAARAKAGILWTLEGAEYWNYFEWADGLSGNNGKEDRPQESAALTLFFYAALRAYDKVCPDGRYEAAAAAVRERFHRTFWDEKAAAYRTFSDTAHYTELVQSLALWCSLVPEELEKDLRGRLADRANPWVKTTLSHYIYKLDALMMEPERYYPEVNRDIMEIWGSMVMEGATSFWETIDGGFAFGRAGSLCHGWSAIPVYFWHKYQAYIADC
mgnify:CR=1 FL=1